MKFQKDNTGIVQLTFEESDTALVSAFESTFDGLQVFIGRTYPKEIPADSNRKVGFHTSVEIQDLNTDLKITKVCEQVLTYQKIVTLVNKYITDNIDLVSNKKLYLDKATIMFLNSDSHILQINFSIVID